jgi:hypothetical protein
MAKRSQYSDQMPWNHGNLEIFDPWMHENQSKPLGNGEFRKPGNPWKSGYDPKADRL